MDMTIVMSIIIFIILITIFYWFTEWDGKATVWQWYCGLISFYE